MTSVSGSEKGFIGIDLSGPVLRAAIVNDNGEITERREAPIEADGLVAQVERVVSDLRGVNANVDRKSVV